MNYTTILQVWAGPVVWCHVKAGVQAGNALLAFEGAYADGVAEMEQAGHRVAGVSVFGFLHKLEYVARRREPA